MSEINIYQVDAFADRAFVGNPAAVCILDKPLPAELMQAIAAENNLAETAFAVGGADHYELRWFTPAVEVPLCGHATLATAHVLFNELGFSGSQLRFATQSGELTVRRDGPSRSLFMTLPTVSLATIPEPPGLAAALGAAPQAVHRGRYVVCEFARAADVTGLRPDFGRLAAIPASVCVTAPGDAPYDFVSRFFAVPAGVLEDPVTGSAHCDLTPFWAKRLGKSRLRARQASVRGGDVDCELLGEQVVLGGPCVTVLRGTLLLPAA